MRRRRRRRRRRRDIRENQEGACERGVVGRSLETRLSYYMTSLAFSYREASTTAPVRGVLVRVVDLYAALCHHPLIT
jgi:hypothetical protein